MADSLNTGIQKLGDTLSAKLFGNSKDNPDGADNFSGVYIGPGGGVTRQDSFTIDADNFHNYLKRFRLLCLTLLLLLHSGKHHWLVIVYF